MKMIQQFAATAALCLIGTASAFAQGTTFQNGGFDTLSPASPPSPALPLYGQVQAGWTFFGDVDVTSPRNVLNAGNTGRVVLSTATVEFEDDIGLDPGSNNNSGNSPINFFGPNNLAGVPVGLLDIGGSAIEGSAIRQDFIATAGDALTVTFDWAFLTTDTEQPDYGFVAVNNSVVSFVNIFSTPKNSQFNGSFGDFDNVDWGWSNASYTYNAVSGGAVSFVIGLVDINDDLNTSELRIDNISISAVPEPETYAMLLAGLGLMGAVARRRKLG